MTLTQQFKKPLPQDFALDESLRQYAEERLPHVDASEMFEGFCVSAEAKGWRFIDWRRAWQMYVRNSMPKSGHWAAGHYPKLSANIDWNKPVDPQRIKW